MWRTLSLRARLVLGVLALAGAGLLVADAATYASLRSFLIDRTDDSLQSVHAAAQGALQPHERRPLDRAGFGGHARPQEPPLPGDRPPPGGGFGRVLPGLFMQIRSPTGQVLVSRQASEFPGTATTPPPRLPAKIDVEQPPAGQPDRARYFSVPAVSGGTRYRVRASIELGSTSLLVVATSLRDVDAALHRLLLIELLVTALVLMGIVLLGALVVRVGLRPLDAIGSTAAAIAAGDLSKRVHRAEERTEVGRLGLALNTMLAQIERAFEARAASERKLRRFVADASHELRTPLAAVRAYAELFTRGADRRPQDLARVMTGISRESERMSALVDDLLLLARLDEGRPLEREPVRLDRVVEDAVETARTVEPDRPITLDAHAAVVLGDRERLRQVVDNLLGNARAHTPPRLPVQVRVGRSNGSALLAVHDSGPGISREEVERLFERFYRADSSRSRASGGVGLGLAIVAAVAEAHGGSVSARSEPGRGSTFELALPLLAE